MEVDGRPGVLSDQWDAGLAASGVVYSLAPTLYSHPSVLGPFLPAAPLHLEHSWPLFPQQPQQSREAPAVCVLLDVSFHSGRAQLRHGGRLPDRPRLT